MARAAGVWFAAAGARGPAWALLAAAVLTATLLTAAVLAAGLAGCAAEELAPPLADYVAKAAKPPPGRALIFVYRPSGAGSGIHPLLLVNGTPRGFLDARTYFLLEVPPGTVTLTVDAVSPNSMDETVAAGETKYVQVTLAPDLMSAGQVGIDVLANFAPGRTFRGYPAAASAEEARPGLKPCRLVRFIRL
jgi:hypothetical protein